MYESLFASIWRRHSLAAALPEINHAVIAHLITSAVLAQNPAREFDA
jgi:hypothetical protein